MAEINEIKELPEGNFPINLKFIQQHQQSQPRIISKYKYGIYHKVFFRGCGNDKIKLITCEDKILIPSKVQSYILHWYHTYLIHPRMDRTDVIICQHL